MTHRRRKLPDTSARSCPDKQGYISATILNITVTSQSQTTIINIQSMPQLAIMFRSLSDGRKLQAGALQRVARQGAINSELEHVS